MIRIGAINMPESLAAILIFFGVSSAVFLVGLVMVLAKDSIGDYIDRKKYEYKRKHRFDKPPLAKCYCKDCCYHHDNCHCSEHDGWYTAADWFCWAAEPRAMDPDKEDKNNV